MSYRYYAYIMASGKNGTIHTRITNDIRCRKREHKMGAISGFTKKYTLNRLVIL